MNKSTLFLALVVVSAIALYLWQKKNAVAPAIAQAPAQGVPVGLAQ